MFATLRNATFWTNMTSSLQLEPQGQCYFTAPLYLCDCKEAYKNVSFRVVIQGIMKRKILGGWQLAASTQWCQILFGFKFEFVFVLIILVWHCNKRAVLDCRNQRTWKLVDCKIYNDLTSVKSIQSQSAMTKGSCGLIKDWFTMSWGVIDFAFHQL